LRDVYVALETEVVDEGTIDVLALKYIWAMSFVVEDFMSDREI
jgi:hypothetical protein